jgi:hypothetical protein
VWRFVLLLVVVAVGSYYARGSCSRASRGDRVGTTTSTSADGPDDDDEFLAQISRRDKGPDDPS